eukprot:5772533-Lingulodinium_polyedra.AAC.1
MQEKGATTKYEGLIKVIGGLVKVDEDRISKESGEGPTLYSGYEFLDDVTGKPLDKGLAVAARETEMSFFKKMGVYTKVDRAAVPKGQKIVSTKWLEINKGDDRNPNVRARLVGREIKTDQRVDLFAATPPLESMR